MEGRKEEVEHKRTRISKQRQENKTLKKETPQRKL